MSIRNYLSTYSPTAAFPPYLIQESLWKSCSQSPTRNTTTHGFTALAGHHLDEFTKSSAYLWETIHDPTTAHSDEPTETVFNRAFQTSSDVWTWLNSAEQAYRQRRFDIAMRGVAAMQPADAILNVFDWRSLPRDSVVVDVGGGVGASSLPLAQEHAHLKLVVQDRHSVVEEGIKLWKTKNPSSPESKRVQFQAHDFFTTQPIKHASLFLLKQILHDWPNSYAGKILTKPRKALQPHTTLVLIDTVLPLACKDPRVGDKAAPGAVPREPAAPLLANYGVANEMGYNADITMHVIFNSLERTVGQLEALLLSSGWKLTKVHRSGVSNFLQPVEAVPI